MAAVACRYRVVTDRAGRASWGGQFHRIEPSGGLAMGAYVLRLPDGEVGAVQVREIVEMSEPIAHFDGVGDAPGRPGADRGR